MFQQCLGILAAGLEHITHLGKGYLTVSSEMAGYPVNLPAPVTAPLLVIKSTGEENWTFVTATADGVIRFTGAEAGGLELAGSGSRTGSPPIS